MLCGLLYGKWAVVWYVGCCSIYWLLYCIWAAGHMICGICGLLNGMLALVGYVVCCIVCGLLYCKWSVLCYVSCWI